MKKITDFIVNRRKWILVLFLFFAIISIFLSQKVKINYDMTEYLPNTSDTKKGKDIMDKEFDSVKESYLNIMFKDLLEEDKKQIYEKLVSLNDNLHVDYEKESDLYNKDQYTLYKITLHDAEDSKMARDLYHKVMNEFRDYEFYMSGNIKSRHVTIIPPWIMILAVIIVLVILIIMCESYLEPLLFLACIGIAIMLNNGTNILFGTVSNITSSISAILQLALSMDYSIMLINRYRQEHEIHKDKVEAMKEALHKSFSSISSSSITTIVGLITLVFMSFTIGRDMGLVLAKGVLLSLLVIFTCLPAFILMFDKIIKKTKKKTPNITLNHFGNFIYKFRSVSFLLLLVLFIGSTLLKGNLNILYTPSDEDKIKDVFRENNQIAILYHNQEEEKIAKLLKELENTFQVDEVLGFGNTIGEKLKYNEFNQKLSDLNTDIKIDEDLLKILYYHYFNDSTKVTMTFDEFVLFAEKNVLNNNHFSSKFDKEISTNINRLKNFTSTNEINKKRSYQEIAKILEIKEKDIYNLFVYYNANKINIRLTIPDFVNFINKDVLTNQDYSKSIPQSSKNDLLTLTKFIDKNTITKSMNSTSMANLFGLDKKLVDDLYLYYFSINGVDNKLSIHEFANFVINNVLTNNEYKNTIDPTIIARLKMLQMMSDKNVIDKTMNAKELGGIFGIDENIVTQLLLFENMGVDNGTTNYTKTPYQFVQFILDNRMNEPIAGSMSKENLENLQFAFHIMNSAKNNQKYSSSELSKIVGIEDGITKIIYTLNAKETSEFRITPEEFVDFLLKHKDQELKDNLNTKVVSDIKRIDTIIESVLNNQKYSIYDMSSLLGLKREDVKILYSFYNSKYINSNMVASLKEFVEFMLNDVLRNELYSSKINQNQVTLLKTIHGIMDSVLNGIEYNPEEIFAIISKLTDTLDEDAIELFYIYYGSSNYFQEDYTISIEDFINYVNDNIMKDRRFDAFLEEDMKNKVNSAKKTIQDSKEMLVGKNYSRVIMNTKFDLESDEVYHFIQKIDDYLDGTESYIIGDSSMSYEMSKTFTNEFNYISILTMVAIFIVVAITFKSFITPLILVLIIQCAVYMIMGILGLTGSHVYFIALLVVQSILMGATIDYAIVYTTYYIESRESLTIRESIRNAYNQSIHTILTSASILIIATLLVGNFASGIVGMLCTTLSQGVICATILILFILPGTIAFLDKFVVKKKTRG